MVYLVASLGTRLTHLIFITMLLLGFVLQSYEFFLNGDCVKCELWFFIDAGQKYVRGN